jgi:hypothetical protein
VKQQAQLPISKTSANNLQRQGTDFNKTARFPTINNTFSAT